MIGKMFGPEKWEVSEQFRTLQNKEFSDLFCGLWYFGLWRRVDLYVVTIVLPWRGHSFLPDVGNRLKTTRSHNAEDHNPHFHRCDNIKSHHLLLSE